MFILLLLLLPLLLSDVGEELISSTANFQVVFILSCHFRKKIKPNLNASLHPARITTTCRI
jgi:hypothetical protein